MTLFILLALFFFLVFKAIKVAKNNPVSTIKTASIIREFLRK